MAVNNSVVTTPPPPFVAGLLFVLVTRRSPAESQRRQVSFLSSEAACRRAAKVGAVIRMTDDDLGSTLLGAEIASPRLILKMGGQTAQSFPSEAAL